MSGRARITVTIDGTVVAARGWQVAELLKAAGIRPVYSGAAAGGGGWIFDRTKLGDALAYFENRRIAVRIIDPDQPDLFDGAEGGGAA